MLRKDKKGQEGMIELFDLRKSGEGYPIVLTTDRTLASDYNGSEFIGFGATFPKVLPAVLYRSLFAPAVPQKKWRSKIRPLR